MIVRVLTTTILFAIALACLQWELLDHWRETPSWSLMALAILVPSATAVFAAMVVAQVRLAASQRPWRWRAVLVVGTLLMGLSMAGSGVAMVCMTLDQAARARGSFLSGGDYTAATCWVGAMTIWCVYWAVSICRMGLRMGRGRAEDSARIARRALLAESIATAVFSTGGWAFGWVTDADGRWAMLGLMIALAAMLMVIGLTMLERKAACR